MLKLITGFKKYIIEFCQLLINKLSISKPASSFNSLMPKENIDISNYQDALDYIFSSEDTIKNIAILGAYGSGKSSIINTYEKQHPEHKFIHISLAHFTDNTEFSKTKPEDLKETDKNNIYILNHNGINTENANKDSVSNLLEGKILNQLIHQIKASNVKETNFKVKKIPPWYQKLFYSFIILFGFISILYVSLYSKWSSWITSNNYNFLKFTLSDNFQLIVFIGCLLVLSILVYSFVSISYRFKHLKKLGIKNVVDIEVFDSSNDSSFDKYLNEVIYLFQNSKSDVIVFEDLDRYDSVMIFEKLREINYLINNKNSNRPIRFLYLIRDDIFNTFERSKFFDFIIPIVPVVDITNASHKFTNLLNDANCLDGLDTHFIYDIAYYINDMRLLYNIVNEYQVYRKVIGPKHNTNYNANYQLAIIVYKNLFPEDFHALQAGHGYIYNVLQSKEDLCKASKLHYENKKAELYNALREFEKQTIQNIDELNALYFPFSSGDFRIANETIPKDISRPELIKTIIQTTKPVTVTKNGSTQTISIKDVIEKMEANPEYASRRDAIKLYSSDNSKNILSQIEYYTKEINIISTKRLKTLINETGAELFWDRVNNEYKNKHHSVYNITSDRNFPVIKYLVTNGLLNEDYSLYSSYIYSDELTSADRGFILSINEGKKNPYTYKLDNPQSVIEHINPAAFMLNNIHNFDLLEHVLKSYNDNIIATWFDTIDAHESDNYTFIIEFIMMHLKDSNILKNVVSHRPAWLYIWYIKNLINEADFRRILFAIIDACPLNNLENINVDMWLTNKLSNDSSYIVSDTNNISKYCQALKFLNVVFNNIVLKEKANDVLNFVYENDMYRLTSLNIIEVISLYTKYNIDKDIATFYSYVFKNKSKPICKYLLRNPNDLLDFLLSYSKRKFNDEPNIVLTILNNENITNDKKISYMEKSSVKIVDLSNVTTNALWTELLRIRAFKPTWRNYLIYFCKIEISNENISEELLTCMCLAKNPSVLALKKLRELLGADNASKFIKKIIYAKQLSYDDYRRILKYIGFTFTEFSHKFLESWQITILLDINCVPKTKEVYNFIKQNYVHNIYDFLFLGNSKIAFKLIKDKEIILEPNEILNCLSDTRINDEQSKILLDLYTGNISLENKKYSDEVCHEIIKNHFNVEDLPWLLRKYQSFGPKAQESILDYSKQNPSRIITTATSQKCLPAQVYSLLISENICTTEESEMLLGTLSDPRYNNLCKSKKSPSFDNLEYNIKILNHFKKEGWISSYGEYKGKLRGYPKRSAS